MNSLRVQVLLGFTWVHTVYEKENLVDWYIIGGCGGFNPKTYHDTVRRTLVGKPTGIAFQRKE
jgi:hypothetical protein